MARLVLRLRQEAFVVWSTTVDAPASPVLPADELIEHLRAAGESEDDARAVVARAAALGTPDPSYTLDDAIAANRAARLSGD